MAEFHILGALEVVQSDPTIQCEVIYFLEIFNEVKQEYHGFVNEFQMGLGMKSKIATPVMGDFTATIVERDFRNSDIVAAFTDANNNNQVSIKIQIKALLINSEISGPGSDVANIPTAQFQIDLVNENTVEACADHSFEFVDTIENGDVRAQLLELQIAQQ